jgi:hypothetical protein
MVPGGDGTYPFGAIVRYVDGGAGKDSADIAACFNPRSSRYLPPIIVRDVERVTIVPCPSDHYAAR